MLSCEKSRFLLPENEHYLNCAYLSPVTREIENAALDAMAFMRRPSTITTDMFFRTADEIRAEFGQIIGTPDQSTVAILPSVSYGIATVAKNTPIHNGQRIVVIEEQFPSNIYSWKRLADERGAIVTTVASPRGHENRAALWNERILAAIDHRTAVVALPHAHWTDGTRFDVEMIGRRAREVGALFVIDGSQSVGAVPIDVQSVKPDALICAGYKWLFGPYSVCLGYFGPRLLNGIPLEENWIAREGSENFAGLVNYQDRYEPGAIRFDVGERSNFLLLPMMLAGLRQINEWGPGRIQDYCARLFEPALKELQQFGYQVEEAGGRFSHLVGIRLPDTLSPDRLRTALVDGSVHVSVRGTAIRVSPHVYNDARDVEALVDILQTASHG